LDYTSLSKKILALCKKMPKHKIPEEYRRKLPHIQPQNAVFFVTFNLIGAMPLHILKQYSRHSCLLK